MNEQWRISLSFPEYMVSDAGRIKRRAGPNARGRIMKERILGCWNGVVNLRRNGQSFALGIAPLILEAFIGPAPSHIKKPCARHLDDDRSNNNLVNLAWGTQKQNIQDAIDNGKFGPLGRKQTPEEKEKRSLALLGRPKSEQHRKRLKSRWTDEERRKQSERLKGLTNPLAVLTESQVLEIKKVYVGGSRTAGAAALGRVYGVHASTIKKWAHSE